MHLKIGYAFLAISIFFIVIFGIDKITSENPSDSALIRIGLSDTDSSQCEICQEGEMYFESGCKRCIQDGIVLTAHVSNERFYSLGWSNDNGMWEIMMIVKCGGGGGRREEEWRRGDGGERRE